MKDFKLTDDPTYYKRKKREWYLKNKEKVAAQAKAWQEAHPERTRENIARWKTENPERVRVHEQKASRKQRLKQFDLTVEQYEEILHTQNGQCAICAQLCSSGRRLSVDHNHKTGNVRGLLCTRCNVRLGMIENVRAMRFKLRPFLRYLIKHGDYR